MNRLVAVSNRVPSPSKLDAGGLAVGLKAALEANGGLWFGWSGEVRDAPAPDAAVRRLNSLSLATIDLSPGELEGYYNGFSNRTLWPLLHGRVDLAAFEHEAYQTYDHVNEIFAARLGPLLGDDDTIWVHDYHLIPLGRALRRGGFGQAMGFFLHVPFPAPETFAALPWHEELIGAFCAYDLVGFQTERDQHNFLEFIRDYLDGDVAADGTIRVQGHSTATGVFPIGIDADGFALMAASLEGEHRYRRVTACLHGQAAILGVDRLDYTKGLLERLSAYEGLLEQHPEYLRQSCLVQIAAPSRELVPEYLAMRDELDLAAGHINGRFSELDWIPVRYLNRTLGQAELSALYRYCRVGLVTPLRDGMNLVAKEYVASQNPDDPGVLVLSRFAGAAERMQGALIVNPFDRMEMTAALDQALRMPNAERKARWHLMMAELRRHDVAWWRDGFLAALRETRQAEPKLRAAS